MIVTGCGIFETRTPEPPSQTSSGFIPPTTANIVLDNLINSIQERNTDNYIRCFVDTAVSDKRFSFVPTQEAQSQYAAVFSSWALSSERAYFENLKSHTPASSTTLLALNNGKFESTQSDSAIYSASYLLIFQHNVSGIPQESRGNLQFYLAPDRRGFWVIYRWIDIKTGSDFSWSEMKGKFSI